ncbi:MAG: sodium:proton antiporter [Oscillospiraceae bacterium]|nr:sodium:proton antiporter [Oscillospiraceae bacterium]
MNFACNLPLFCMVLCLLCAVISSVLHSTAARRLTLCLAGAVMSMNLYLLIWLLRGGQSTSYMMGHYPHPWGNEIRIGIVEALFSAAFALILGLCVAGGRTQLLRDLNEKKTNLYYAALDLVLVSLQALCYTNDLFTGYVFIEIGTIAACGILMIRQIGRTTLAAVRYMIFSLIGSGLFMLGIIFLYAVTGHLLMPNLRQAVETLWDSGSYRLPLLTALCLQVIGLGIKSGLFPFHFWMPDTYGYATPASAGVLSGLVSKGYILLLLKIVYDVYGTRVFYASGVQNLLYIFGILGMIAGSVSAMREDDLFRMIAYSSAAQIGYIYMGIGISPAFGILGALFHILTHALTKPAIFLAAAQLSDAAGGGRDLETLQGAAHRDHLAGAAFALGALNMIGLPMTMGFISKYLFADAAFHAGGKLIPTLLALALSTILNTFYFMRALIRLFNRPLDSAVERVPMRTQVSYTVAASVFGVANLAIGIFAQPMLSLLSQGLEQF